MKCKLTSIYCRS